MRMTKLGILISIMILLSACGTEEINQNTLPQEPASEDPLLAAKAENTSDRYVYLANLDETDDSERIYIVNDSPDNSYYHVSVENSEHEEIWSQDFSTTHAGEGAVFLCTLDGKDYLLEYNPWVGQGMAAYRYFLIDFQNDTRHVAAQKEVEFELYTQDHLEERIAFMDEVNALLEQSQVIMSTLNGKAVIGLVNADEFQMTEEQLYISECKLMNVSSAKRNIPKSYVTKLFTSKIMVFLYDWRAAN